MVTTVLSSILDLAADPPPPQPRRPDGAAFQRRLAEQQAARNAAEAAPAPRARPAAASQPRAQPASRPAGERDAPARQSRERPGAPDAAPGPVTAWGTGGGAGGGAGGGNGGGGGGQREADAPSRVAAPCLADDLDCEALLDLLPCGGDSGIFELLLPGGDRLAVVADITARRASFLLTPSSERLRERLQRGKMELERGLARRMHRHVILTVL